MSDKLTLTKNGFRSHRWDGESYSKLRTKKAEDGIIVYDRKTKEEIARYPTMEDFEKLYWIDETDKERFWVSILRTTPIIEDGCTVQDFINAIKQHEALDLTCQELFGENWADNIPKGCSVNIYRVAHIIDGQLSIHSSTIPTDDGKELLNVAKKMKIRIGTLKPHPVFPDSKNFVQNEEYEELYCMSLLEIMDGLFGNGWWALQEDVWWTEHDKRKSVFFDKDDSGQLFLRYETGEEIENGFKYILHPVEILCDLTVNGIFDWMERNPTITFFISGYSWCGAIREFHEEAKNKNHPDDQGEKLNSTEISRHFQIHKGHRSNPDWVHDDLHFGGLGDVREEDKKMYEKHGNCPDQQSYAIEFSPVSHYSSLPLVLNREIEFMIGPKYGRSKLIEPAKSIAVAESEFTLLDILDAIYDEISFNGTPAKRDAQKDELISRVDEIKSKNPEEMKIKKYKSIEEMMDDDTDEKYDAYTIEFEDEEE